MTCLWVVIRVGRKRRQVTNVPDECLSPRILAKAGTGTEPGLQTLFILHLLLGLILFELAQYVKKLYIKQL